MAQGEYITIVDDYKKHNTKELTPALHNHLSTTLCKEKVRLNNSRRTMPKTPLEELIFWRLSIGSSDN